MDDDVLDRALRTMDPGAEFSEREAVALAHLVERTRMRCLSADLAVDAGESDWGSADSPSRAPWSRAIPSATRPCFAHLTQTLTPLYR